MSERKILYLEPLGGIAGDMFLAAGLDLGVPLAELEKALSGLGASPFQLVASKAERHAIVGTHLDVQIQGSDISERSYRDICALVKGAKLPGEAEARALGIFEIIAQAESKVHGVSLDEVHFHEVGAVDSLVDVCGAAVVLELLGNPEVFATPPPLGSGWIKTAHGSMPVPAPATLEILREVPVRFEGKGELTTPTGAALVKAFAQVTSPGQLRVEKVGYGVGTNHFPDRPNVLRATLAWKSAPAEEFWMVEVNLDDCSPQLLGWLLERALELGAVDAYIVPVTMKKSRPGQLFCSIVPAAKRKTIAELLLSESTTLGVRWYAVDRWMLDRKMEWVATAWGQVRIKLGLRGDEVVNVQPEYEDCRRLAQEKSVPLKQVMAGAVAAYFAAHP